MFRIIFSGYNVSWQARILRMSSLFDSQCNNIEHKQKITMTFTNLNHRFV